ncbi:PREDICTED: uncharacterized protein LOC104772723 [Camelina sativa]|uniref:Uncharacterized protein LOC104772723 n=1 Tax=Camelina sativa TaxID=90675 RepID=A0ABM0Y509_CAMSA|nr:PREDICTED: uncharacterized protein LOC104772723 [Camelina sativa]
MSHTFMLDSGGGEDIFDASFLPETTKKTRVLKLNMREAQERHRSYADHRRKDIEFKVDDRVIVERVGPIAYKLELPVVMHAFHKIFHVLMLRKCLHRDDEVLAKILADLQPNMTLEARPVRVLERRIKELQGKRFL